MQLFFQKSLEYRISANLSDDYSGWPAILEYTGIYLSTLRYLKIYWKKGFFGKYTGKFQYVEDENT